MLLSETALRQHLELADREMSTMRHAIQSAGTARAANAGLLAEKQTVIEEQKRVVRTIEDRLERLIRLAGGSGPSRTQGNGPVVAAGTSGNRWSTLLVELEAKMIGSKEAHARGQTPAGKGPDSAAITAIELQLAPVEQHVMAVEQLLQAAERGEAYKAREAFTRTMPRRCL